MLKRLKNHLLAMLQAQLVLTLTSLPILIHWGLPISYMTFVGNVLFTPVLMVFIFTSSLLFFTQLCSIPNYFLVVILEKTTAFWNYLLSWGTISWLYGFVHPGVSTLVFLGLVIIVTLCITIKITFYQRLCVFSAVLTVIVGALITYQCVVYQPKPFCDQKCSIFYDDNQGITFIDKGFFASKKTPDKAIYFDLRPFIIKRYGTMHFNRLIITRPGIRSLQSALICCKLFSVRTVCIPYFNYKLTKKGWAIFFALKRYAAEHNICFDRSYRPTTTQKKSKITRKKYSPSKQVNQYKDHPQKYTDIWPETEEALGHPA